MGFQLPVGISKCIIIVNIMKSILIVREYHLDIHKQGQYKSTTDSTELSAFISISKLFPKLFKQVLPLMKLRKDPNIGKQYRLSTTETLYRGITAWVRCNQMTCPAYKCSLCLEIEGIPNSSVMGGINLEVPKRNWGRGGE